MKVSELRIGNWYLSTKFQTPVICEMGDFYEIYARADGSAEYNVDEIFEPIPLTEEWIKKFHTDEEVEKSERFPNEITIHDRFLFIWKEQYKYWYVISRHHKEYLTKIEFVHEYQDFILALTGINIKING